MGVVIPALNEAEALPEMLRRIAALGLRKITVVDNGSTDETAAVARSEGAQVVPEPRRGYGMACWAGCAALAAGVQWILFCNADGSDDVESFPEMMAEAENGADFVLGRRVAGPDGRHHLTLPQVVGNRLASSLIRLWGVECRDLGPLRLISRQAFENLHMEDRGFGWTVEMQVRAAEEKLKTAEVPVRSLARTAGESKISGTISGSVQAGLVILSTLGRLWLRRGPVQRGLGFAALVLLVLGACLMVPWGRLEVVGNVPRFLAMASVMGAGYAVSWALRSPGAALLWSGAILSRVALLFIDPGDDIWRYLWEGRVNAAGFNPYQLAPNAEALAFLRDDAVWPHVGHPTLTAVYPPLTQLSFAGMTLAGWGLGGFKLVFALADLAVVWLLARQRGRSAAMLYGWNPLVIYSFAGGGHYDSLFLLPLVVGLLLAADTPSASRWYLSALLAGASVAVKYASGPLVFWWMWQAWKRSGVKSVLLTGVAFAAPLALSWGLFFPGTAWRELGPHDWVTFSKSAQCVPWLVEQWMGYAFPNQLWLLPVLGVAIWLALRSADSLRTAERFFFWVLVLSPAIHGWYLTWFIAAAATQCRWSARMAGLSGFAYFWLQHVNATQGVWEISLPVRLALWLPILLPALWESQRRTVPACGETPNPSIPYSGDAATAALPKLT